MREEACDPPMALLLLLMLLFEDGANMAVDVLAAAAATRAW